MSEMDFIRDSGRYLMDTYSRFPLVLRKGRGTKVWSTDGREYLDFVGGVATNVLGHCHPRVVIALQKQAQRLIHASNHFHMEPQIELARLLVENSFAGRAFFCNSGAEAVEAAIKLVRKYARLKSGRDDRVEIITAIGSFHGRTMGALSATGQEELKKGFEPLLPGFSHVPFDDTGALESAIGEKTCAVMLEPILGEGGVVVPDAGYLRRVRELCDASGALMILDEIQTGVGRTGKLFAYEHSGVEPDVMVLAKGLGGGVPIGAVLATGEVSSGFSRGDHGSTFGGNPLATAAALATVQTVLEDGVLIEESRRLGEYLMGKLHSLKNKFPSAVAEVRGMGLLAAMELTTQCRPVVEACIERGVLVNCTAGNVLRFMPPLTVLVEEIDRVTEVVGEVMKEGI